MDSPLPTTAGAGSTNKRVHCLRLHAFSLADSCGISGVFVQGVAAPALLAEVGAGFSWKGSFL